ncbi:MAG: phosphoglucosamine mutase [Oscillospiraceae bacterium]|nr:phosphoglucosamine mutase [Oscillospiraceae bacterium]
MGKLFGTDGIRGVVGQTLTAETAYQTGRAVVTVLTQKLGRKPLITIGKDTRISSDMLESALIAGICAAGGDVMPFGTVPTPAVAFLTVQEQADAGIVISASHNPYEHNGIKVFNGKGYKLPDEMEAKVEELILHPELLPTKTHGEIGRRMHGMRQKKKNYIHHLYSSIDCDLTGLRVLVDCANGAASATAPQLFGMLPLQADFIHAEPDGININTGCGSTHLASLSQGVVAGKYDLGVAFDGDADRCLMVDEKGNTIDGDKIMAVCATQLRRQGLLRGNAIVATVMSNLGLHEFCRENGMTLICTDVGDRHVLEKMVECDYAIGGEQSGHMIFRRYATTGDGELTALQFLQALRRSGLPASQLASCCPKYPQELINVAVPVAYKQQVMDSSALWEQVRAQEDLLHGDGRILIRPSGTEALIRVMVEAKTEALASNVASDLANYIKNMLKI